MVMPLGYKKKFKARRGLTPEEEAGILNLLFEGRNPNSICKIVGRDRGVVLRVAERHKRELSEVVQKRLKFKDPILSDGLTAYSRYLKSERRQEVLSFAMDKIERMLQRDQLPAKDLRDVAVALGVIVDKFAVETGKTDDTARAAIVQLFQRIDMNAKNEKNEARDISGSSSSSGEASEILVDGTQED